MSAPLLTVDDLRVAYATRTGPREAVRGVSFVVRRGETTALVGESGSGKSTIAQAVIGLLPAGGSVTGGGILLSDAGAGAGELGGEGLSEAAPGSALDLTRLSESRLRALRGARIGVIPQDPTTSLDPLKTIGASVAEALRIHGWRDRRRIRARVIDLLERVDIDDPERRAAQYPHELSGGMRQRVLIAAAVALEPELIIADEPTSALDVTVQRRVLELIDRLRTETGTGVLFITHDLAVAADHSEHLVVLRDGAVQEQGATRDVLAAPTADYTRRLIADAPSLSRIVVTERAEQSIQATDASAPSAPTAEPLVVVEGLRQEFGGRRHPFVAVDDVSFTIPAGTTHALVGESGSGKTTTGRAVAGFQRPSAGLIRVDGIDVTSLASGRGAAGSARTRAYRRTAQLVYQNPFSSLDPRQRVGEILAEPLRNFGIGGGRGDAGAAGPSRAARVAQALERVALPADAAERLPAELSGGQRQRVAIARALILEPRLVVFDEAVSALDVTVQAQILRLLGELQRELGLTYLFISHDLAVVRQISDTVSVLHRGRQVEHGPVEQVFEQPRDAYTQRLIAAIPGARLRESLSGIEGSSGGRLSASVPSERIPR